MSIDTEKLTLSATESSLTPSRFQHWLAQLDTVGLGWVELVLVALLCSPELGLSTVNCGSGVLSQVWAQFDRISCFRVEFDVSESTLRSPSQF